MKKILVIFFASILVLGSCKKKEFPQTVTGNPAFYISAVIDGQPITLQAGTLDYYMYSSYTQDNDGIYTFVAEVKPKSCANTCPNSIKIELYDDQISTQGGASNINSSVKPGTYQFVNTDTLNPTVVGYAVTYKSSFNLSSSSPSYTWDFGYGAPSYSALPTHTYATAGAYITKLSVATGSPPTSASIDNVIKVTTATNVCRTHIVPTVNGNTVSFYQSTVGSGNYSYHWEFGDGFSSPDVTPIHTYTSPGRYLVNLKVIDSGNSDTAWHNYYVNTDLSQEPAPNFYAANITPILSNSPLAKIKISYTDGSGKIYSSNIQPQISGNSEFKITSVEEYKTNENNQATKKLRITFNCKLYNGTNSVDVTNGEAIIAVAYK